MRRFAVLTLGVAMLAGCAADPVALRTPSVETLVPGTLTACTDMPFEPFEFPTDGDVAGIDVDLVRAVAGDLGLRAEFRNTDFDAIFDDLVAGKCDLVASAVSITDERRQKYLFSDGYFEVNQSLLVRSADAARFATLAALSGRRLGVQKGTTGADYAKAKAPGVKLVSYEDGTELVAALGRGEVDGAVQDFPINSYLANRSGAYVVSSTFTDVQREEYGFALRQGSEPLRDSVDRALSATRENGRYDAILGKYLGDLPN